MFASDISSINFVVSSTADLTGGFQGIIVDIVMSALPKDEPIVGGAPHCVG